MPVEVDTENEEFRIERGLRKSGNSVVVSLHPKLLEEADFELGDEVVVATGFNGGEITLKKPGPTDTDEATVDEQPAD